MMTHGSLFSGIGGFDLAAEWMGWNNVFHCEIEEFPRSILKHYWPKAKSYGDIKQTDFTIWKGKLDILTGGFPCQPYSQAGKRLGTEDDRHLWPEMLRAIRESSPRWVVGENVRGLLNWTRGLVFEKVQADLEAIGYEVLPVLLPAAGVNAPHERYRVFFIAHSDSLGLEETRSQQPATGVTRSGTQGIASYPSNARVKDLQQGREDRVHGHELTSDTCSNRPQRSGIERISCPEKNSEPPRSFCTRISPNTSSSRGIQDNREGKSGLPRDHWKNFPSQSPVRNGDDGLPTGSLRCRLVELDNGVLSRKEVDKIISKATSRLRREAIKGGGNAIVVPLVYQIFKAIEEYEYEIKD